MNVYWWRSSLTAAIVATACGSAFPQVEINIFRFVTTRKGHTAKIVFRTGEFNPSAHKIVHTKRCITVDGREPLGRDCSIPRNEIKSIQLVFDDSEITIPKDLYSDCYEPPFVNA